MRFAFASAVVLACVSVGCGAGLNQSNGAKMGEALAFAAVAGAAQVVQSVAEQHARNSAPVTRAGGVGVSPQCDNEGQYGCVSVSGSPSSPANAPEAELNDDEARDYVLGYVNGVRKLNAVIPVVRDEALDAFAQAGSEELGQDHKQNQHMALHAQELHAVSTELQGSPDGSGAGILQDQIAESLLRWMGEGRGGMHHDTLLRPEWRKVGVGIVRSGGRMYFTVDFSG
jgi:uncharacterized protein YkwD